MGLPASGFEAAYRNRVKTVKRFLELHHHDHYLVVNVSERSYDYSLFGYNIVECSFPDHYPPRLNALLEMCRSMHSWIRADRNNIVAVHCKAGKVMALLHTTMPALVRISLLLALSAGPHWSGPIIIPGVCRSYTWCRTLEARSNSAGTGRTCSKLGYWSSYASEARAWDTLLRPALCCIWER